MPLAGKELTILSQYTLAHDDFASMFQTRGGLKPERIDPAYGDVESE